MSKAPSRAKKPVASTNKTAAKKPAPAATATGSGPRRLKIPKYNSFRLRSRVKVHRPKLPGAFRLLGRSLLVLKRHWKLFLIIIIVYGILNVILVRGLAGATNLSDVKSSLNGAFKGNGGQFSTGLTLFVYLLGSSGNSSNANAGVYQTILIILVSLATIWALRQVYNEFKTRARNAFYHGMYPLVPFILVLLVIGLQLIPLLIGGLLYSAVINGGIAVGGLEKFLWIIVFVALALVSLYMLCSSLFALYIVTLPDMTPMKALRSARELVRHRRLVVLRKLLFLPVALLIIAIIIMFPLILFVTPVAAWVFFILTMFGLVVIHSYMYAFYRELLNE